MNEEEISPLRSTIITAVAFVGVSTLVLGFVFQALAG